MDIPYELTEDDKSKLRSAYRILEEFSEHDFPVIRFNCRKAKNELWQALFELDLIPPETSERTTTSLSRQDGCCGDKIERESHYG